ncbi:MAG: bifunctional (p)ppGpp synthetase/guanosine-3',5'-bis(diphosphate) 3'-pyrophosphohydrolase [Candidatus Paracaedibacteraceae bacterium]|nr:bifunctional (p)ppGpp synthetase/guanosine-3',5'-bis(diphosphate) 3'-pyrophosphohydrolase [Candidatus Paracaedibacteraceae bacterium]
MLRQCELVERLRAYDPTVDDDLINRAYVFSVKSHGCQVRDSGDPYFSHPIEVAGILTELKLDSQSIVTGLLHDTVEDTVATIEEIESCFGVEIAQLVNGVTKLSKLELQSEATKQAENFRKLVLAMSSDIRVLLVKLADRLHNMRTLHHVVSEEKRRRIAHETLEIYAPLAERMGIHWFKDELEDLAFAQLQPDIYESIKSRLKFIHQASVGTIEHILQDIKDVAKKFGLSCMVSGRLKTPYSIWRKMQQKNVTLEQLSDIMAFRILVGSMSECYQALGIMHSHYMVVPGRFKDYISTPKPNNYQSLHTCLICPANQRIEVQIRTSEMHEVCENGVAAHWQYKQGSKMHDGKQYAWLRGLLEILEHASSPDEFLEHTKLEMFQDQVFCFTPKGELINLPSGATPVDFAYSIHSEIGNRTVGVKINGRQMPLRTPLKNGDQVDIITAKAQSPSPTWERFVVTGKARACIRRFIRSQQRQKYGELGKSLLQKACIKEGQIFNEKNFTKILSKFHYHILDDLYAAIGEGIQSAKEVLTTTYPEQNLPKKENIPSAPKQKSSKIIHDPAQFIEGLISGMSVHFAGCCHPLPGDNIVGVVVTGKGVTIHTNDCEVITTILDPERVLDLAWHEIHGKEHSYRHIGRLKVTFLNKPGSLAAMTTTISKQSADIVNLKITNRTMDFWDLFIDVEVKDVDHLLLLKASLRSQSSILSVERI